MKGKDNMGYNAEIINEFRGTINGVEFNDKTLFWSVAFILDQLEEQNLQYNRLIIFQLRMGIDYLLRKDYLTLNDIEAEMVVVIEEERCFPYDFVTNPFEDANEELERLNGRSLVDILEEIEMSIDEIIHYLLVDNVEHAPVIALSEGELRMTDADIEIIMDEIKQVLTGRL